MKFVDGLYDLKKIYDERVKISSQKTTAKKGDFASKSKSTDLSSTKSSPVGQVLNLQRKDGNNMV